MFKYDFARQKNARDKLIAIFFSPGVQALLFYRLSHYFYVRNRRIAALFFYRLNISITGADIYPGAEIGRNIIIYHPVGIVIGSTAIIEDNVRIMHGVTLGSIDHELQSKRHPTIKKGVYLGCNATILGGVTIGENAKIGACALVVKDVPPNKTVVAQVGCQL